MFIEVIRGRRLKLLAASPPCSGAILRLLIVMFTLVLAACGSSPRGNAQDGSRWFGLNRCDGCHGENGRGGKGPVLAGTDITFLRFIGKLRHPNSQIMPDYPPDRLSDQDAADIYLWLRQQHKYKRE